MKTYYIIIVATALFSCQSPKEQDAEILRLKSLNTANQQQQGVFPIQKGLINDYEKIFTKEQYEELNKILSDFNTNTNNKIVVLTHKMVKPYEDFQDFAENVGVRWHIEQNNGGNVILIVLSQTNRKIALTKAKGVFDITDEEAQLAISEKTIPELKKNNYYVGIKNGVIEIIKKWK